MKWFVFDWADDWVSIRFNLFLIGIYKKLDEVSSFGITDYEISVGLNDEEIKVFAEKLPLFITDIDDFLYPFEFESFAGESESVKQRFDLLLT